MREPHRHPSSARVASPPSADSKPAKKVGTSDPIRLRDLTAFELALLAANLSASLNKPAEECIGEAESLYRYAEKWRTGYADEHGPWAEFAEGEQIILESTKPAIEVLPEISADIVFFKADTGDEEHHEIVTVRPISTWRGLRLLVERLVEEGFLSDLDPVVSDIEKVRVSVASIRNLNDARIEAAATAAVRRRQGQSGSATYPDFATSEPRRVKIDVRPRPRGTKPWIPGTRTAKETAKEKERGEKTNAKIKSRKSKSK